jgi:integrase
MKRERRIDLRKADIVATPALKSGTTGLAYVAALRAATGGAKKYAASVNVFERWLARLDLTQPLAMDEELLGRFRADIQAGRVRSLSGRKYRSMDRQVPTDIFTLHNLAADAGGIIIRPLLDTRQHERLKYIAGLTDSTRTALLWFHEKGACTRSKQNRPQLMTQATRDGALVAAMTMLRMLDLSGLELVTPAHVAGLLPDPDDDDPKYRRVVHMLREVSTVYRACCKQGLLAGNPLDSVPHSTFADRAQRDFLPPTELERVRDLKTVDMNDWKQVRDRLVMLLLIDTAMRKSELAGVKLSNVRRLEDGSYQITLPPEAQKMRGKQTAHLGIIYPETNRLLAHYMQAIRSRFKGSALVVDGDGSDGSSVAIYNAVIREGERLGLRCYHSNGRPGCHDLRRTFATVNAAPLGLRMTAEELSNRMRAAYEVVRRHYVLQNPLRSAMSDAEYRKRVHEDPVDEVQKHVDALAQLGIGSVALAAVRAHVDSMRKPDGQEDEQTAQPVEWMAEDQAVELLRSSWGVTLSARQLRRFCRKGKLAVSRSGLHGGLHIDAHAMRSLASEFVPLASVTRGGVGVADEVAKKYTAKWVGWVRLIRRVDALDVMRRLRDDQSDKPIRPRSGQTGPGEVVKQATVRGEPRSKSVA